MISLTSKKKTALSEVGKKFRQAHVPRFLLSLTLINDGLWLLPYNHQVFSVRNITLFLRQWRLDYRSLLYRHECFTGKYTTRKIHKNSIRDPSGSERGDGFVSSHYYAHHEDYLMRLEKNSVQPF